MVTEPSLKQHLEEQSHNTPHLDIVMYNKNALNNLRRAVVLGQGQFSLILARVNYQHLQQVLLDDLNKHLSLRSVALSPDSTRLRDAILAQIESADTSLEKQPERQALMVTGLECIRSAEQLAALLKAANLGRDELPKTFDTPVVLWVNDDILQQLNRFAPDLKSFAATPIRFEYPLDALVTVLRTQTERTYCAVLGMGDSKAECTRENLKARASFKAKELPFALKLIEYRVENRAESIDNNLLADLLFLQGRNLYAQGEFERSRSYYESALTHWQQAVSDEQPSPSRSTLSPFKASEAAKPVASTPALNSPVLNSPVLNSPALNSPETSPPETSPPEISPWDKQAILLFHLGLWWRSQAVRDRSDYTQSCEQARAYFESCLSIFRAHRPSSVDHFLLSLAEVLQKLEDWTALEKVAKEGLQLHQRDPIRLARDYGYLAEVAIAQYHQHSRIKQLDKAQTFVQQALDISESEFGKETIRYHRSYYLYLLAIVQQHKGQPATALQTLESARAYTNPRYDLSLYRNILNRLWQLYFEQKHYDQAFDIKLAQRRVESLFGLRAFIGAGQIQIPLDSESIATLPLSDQSESALNAASSAAARRFSPASNTPTQQNTARILAAEIKASGREQDINALINRISQPRYPIVVIHGQSGVGKSSTISAGLVPRLRKLLSEGRTTLPITISSYGNWKEQIRTGLEETSTLASLTEKLKALVQENYQQIVLIFDQFEDFFYEHPAVEHRKELYVFLRDCLEIPYVKVVLALREDFLHYLLEWDRNVDLSVINNDVLSKEVRYYLGNFLPKAAESVIRELTRSAGFGLEEGLITALVDDLAADTGEVRPIELQVVGAQLQRENITTLEAYLRLGRSPKTRLLQNFLDSVIQDCGPENSLIAQSVLFLLSEGDNRPLKSFAEIFAEIEEALSVSGIAHSPHTLKLVLNILVGSGLLFEVPEVSGVRYQLVHEYLADLIQQQPPTALAESGLVDALKTERSRREQSENQLREALANQIAAESASRAKAAQAQIAEIKALVSGARSLRLSGDGIGALSQSLRAAQQLSEQTASAEITLLNMQTALCLDASLREVREKNRLCDHSDWVLAVDCSKTQIVSASEDTTLKLWSLQGKLLQTLTGHQAGVIDVRFSPDGDYIASASLDHTVRIWKASGAQMYTPLHTLALPTASVTSISFSPTQPLLAATYSDAYIRVWNYRTGKEIHAWEGHEDWARTVAFSPDGELLVTGGEDQTVRIWSVAGDSIGSFQCAQGWVRSVSWHPKGDRLVSAGDATTLRLWSRTGRKLKTLYGHEDWVRCVAFSPDGTKLASASDDQTIKIWGIEGTIQQTFYQRSSVHSLAWSADSQAVIAGGDDDLVHIWRLAGPPEPICRAHTGIVWSACWHPQKEQVLSAGGDNKIKLWNAQGKLLQSMDGHKRGVHSLTWSPKGDFFASASADGTVRLWSEQGDCVHTLVGHESAVWRVCYSPDGTLLASVSSDRTLRLWTPAGKLVSVFTGHTDTVWHVSFSPDSKHLITASEDNTLRLWHIDKGLQQTIQDVAKGHDGSVWCAAFSPTGNYLASGDADGDVRLWTVDMQAQQISIAPRPAVLRGHRDWIRGLSFSADGEFLASASDDGTVRLWALSEQSPKQPSGPSSGSSSRSSSGPSFRSSSGPSFGRTIDSEDIERMLPPLAGHDGVVWDVSFDAASQRLATAGADGTLRIWDLRLSSLQAKGCAWLEDWLLTRSELKEQICE